MGSPSTQFVGLPLATLQQIQTDLLSRSVYGSVTSDSAGGKTEGRQQTDPQQALIDVQFAIQKLTGTLPSRKVVNVCEPQTGNGFGAGRLF